MAVNPAATVAFSALPTSAYSAKQDLKRETDDKQNKIYIRTNLACK